MHYLVYRNCRMEWQGPRVGTRRWLRSAKRLWTSMERWFCWRITALLITPVNSFTLFLCNRIFVRCSCCMFLNTLLEVLNRRIISLPSFGLCIYLIMLEQYPIGISNVFLNVEQYLSDQPATTKFRSFFLTSSNILHLNYLNLTIFH